MQIECVTVCVDYADFLAATLPENLPLVDELVVVTSADDHLTQRVCREHSVRFVISEEHTRNGGSFNKARMIRRAFDQHSCDDWVLHLDADIVLPRQFRRMLEWAHLDPKGIYGADRRMLTGWENWKKFLAQHRHWDSHSYECFCQPREPFPEAARWCSAVHGYVPIGYFQLFHGSELIKYGSHIRNYPIHHGTAARTDVQFALQWDRRHRHLLPEVVVLHLDSGHWDTGANWKGRTTPWFGPPLSDTHPFRPLKPGEEPRHGQSLYC